MLSVDDFAAVRYIDSAAFKSMAPSHYPDEEVAAFAAYIHTTGYADLIRGENMLAGYLGEEMVATAVNYKIVLLSRIIVFILLIILQK